MPVRVPAAVFLLLLLAACQDPATSFNEEETPPPAARPGLVEITITGLTTGAPSASARAVSAQPGPSVYTAAPARRAARAPTGRTLSPLPAPGTVQIEAVSTASFTVGARGSGGFRYVSATYRVRNASKEPGNPAYDSPRTNLTFLAVADPSTVGGTAIKTLTRFDDEPATALAPEIHPTGASHIDKTTGLQAPEAPDILQVYTEEEIAGLTIGGGTTALPYGFVVRNPDSPTSRMLPASAEPGDFDGVVTFAFKVPLQAAAADDPFTISALFLPVDDSEAWVTASLEEIGAGETAVLARADSLAARRRVLSAAHLGHDFAQPVCQVRIAGTAAAPTAFAVENVAIQSRSPAPFTGAASFVSPAAAFSVTTDRAMAAPTAAQWIVQGAQSGRHFMAATYVGAGTATISTPAGSFRPGEELTVTMFGIQAAAGAGRLCPQSARYRAAPGAGTAQFTVTTMAVGGPSRGVTLADHDGDGFLDLSVGVGGGALWMPGQGNGTFGSGIAVPAGGDQAWSLLNAELNGDALPDLVVAGQLLGGGFISSHTATGVPGIPFFHQAPVPVSETIGGSYRWAAAADLNSDGYTDVIAIDGGATVPVPTPGNVVVLLRSPDGYSISPHVVPVGVQPGTPVVADFDQSGTMDLAVASAEGIHVLLKDADAFTPAPGSPLDAGLSVYQLESGDMNNDGATDLVAAGLDGLIVLLGDGSAGFSTVPGIPHAIEEAGRLAVGDLDADGNLDVVAPDALAGTVHILLGNGSGALSAAPGSPVSVAATPIQAVLGDINGDGALDIAVSSAATNDITLMVNQLVPAAAVKTR